MRHPGRVPVLVSSSFVHLSKADDEAGDAGPSELFLQPVDVVLTWGVRDQFMAQRRHLDECGHAREHEQVAVEDQCAAPLVVERPRQDLNRSAHRNSAAPDVNSCSDNLSA